MDQYINAGVLTINMDSLRKDNLTLSFKEEMVKGYPQQDQDIINYCCYDHIAFLPLKYNMLNRHLNNKSLLCEYHNQVFTKEEIDEALKNPVVVHFAGGIVKPWVNLRTSYADVWWSYAREFLDEGEYQTWYQRAHDQTVQRDWKYVVEHIRNFTGNIYLFGYSKIAKKLAGDLKKQGVCISAYIDNDKNKQGLLDEGIAVKSLNDVISDTCAAYVITSQNADRDIMKQLLSYGVDREEIFIYKTKTDLYYQSLDPQYYEYEYRDMMEPTLGAGVWDMQLENIKEYDHEEAWKHIWR
jgi:hypothetical protein